MKKQLEMKDWFSAFLRGTIKLEMRQTDWRTRKTRENVWNKWATKPQYSNCNNRNPSIFSESRANE